MHNAVRSAPITAPFAIIIPHFQDHARLSRCLHALLPQCSEGDADIVVVDNGSAERPELPKGVRLIIELESGAAAARNRGVEETLAERIFFLDCDCVPAPNWFATAQIVSERADIVGGTVTTFHETPPPPSGAEAFEAVFAFDNKAYIDRKGFSVTANLLTTRRAFDATGGFRPGVSEDLDWCRRALTEGFTLVHDDRLQVAHPTRSDWPALARKWKRLTEEAWGLRQHGLMGRLRWVALAAAMPFSAAVHTPRVLSSKRLHNFADRRAALRILWRLRLQRSVWMVRQAMAER